MTYAEWIHDYLESIGGPGEAALGKCGAATAAMVLDFPELRRVRGHVLVPGNGDHEMHLHWWCVTPDGEIVDPTASQFSFIITYTEHKSAFEGSKLVEIPGMPPPPVLPLLGGRHRLPSGETVFEYIDAMGARFALILPGDRWFQILV